MFEVVWGLSSDLSYVPFHYARARSQNPWDLSLTGHVTSRYLNKITPKALSTESTLSLLPR
jgi:hypothetical protein